MIKDPFLFILKKKKKNPSYLNLPTFSYFYPKYKIGKPYKPHKKSKRSKDLNGIKSYLINYTWILSILFIL